MNENTRDRFLKRISTVGTGTREVIHMLLGELVLEIRDQVARGSFTDEDIDEVVAFHDRAEDLWRRSLATNPPLHPEELLLQIDALIGAAGGPLSGIELQLKMVRQKGQDLESAHRTRRNDTL